MSETVRKLAQAIVICGAAVAVIWAAWPHALRFPQVWMLVLTSVLANVLQPSYSPFASARDSSSDHGTALQIVWSVYLAQVLNLAEFLWARPELVLRADAYAWFILMLAGLGLRTWAVATLGRWFTWHVEVQPQQEVVVTGPYRFVRHPSYTGAFVTFVAACGLLHSWIAAVVAAVLLGLAFKRRTAYEDVLLKAALPGYDAYARRTGAFLPKLWT